MALLFQLRTGHAPLKQHLHRIQNPITTTPATVLVHRNALEERLQLGSVHFMWYLSNVHEAAKPRTLYFGIFVLKNPNFFAATGGWVRLDNVFNVK